MQRLRGWTSGRVGRRLATLAFALAIFGCYAATVAQDRVVNDVLSASLGSWRIATTGQPWFDGFPLHQIPTSPNQNLWTGIAVNGHVAVFRSPGAIAVGLPAYLLSGRGTTPADFSLLPAALEAALLTTISLLLFLGSLRQRLTHRHALACVAVLGLTTPMWTVSANSLWPHTLTVLGIAGMAWASARERWWLIGVFGGVALWGRLHAALIVAVLGIGLALYRKRPSIAVKVGTISVGFMALAAAWSHWMYGQWNPAGGYPQADQYAQNALEGRSLDQIVNEMGLWVAPDRGLLIWTPVLVLLTPAVIRSWRGLPDWTKVLLVAGIVYTVVQGLMNGFSGGSGFYGYRLTLEMLACAFPAYALSVGNMGRKAILLIGPVIGLQFAAIAVGAFSEGFFLTPDQAWTDNSLLLAVRTVPALALWIVLLLVVGHLGGLVWRARGFGDVSAQTGQQP